MLWRSQFVDGDARHLDLGFLPGRLDLAQHLLVLGHGDRIVKLVGLVQFVALLLFEITGVVVVQIVALVALHLNVVTGRTDRLLLLIGRLVITGLLNVHLICLCLLQHRLPSVLFARSRSSYGRTLQLQLLLVLLVSADVDRVAC